MTDKQKQVDDYCAKVQQRFRNIIDFVTFSPSFTPYFWGDDVIARLPDADRKKLAIYQSEALRLRQQISVCDETIQNRMNACIDHVDRIEAEAEKRAEAMPLFLMTYGMFDETLRLSALAMQSISLSNKIARLLERSSDAATNAAARYKMEEQFASLKQFVSEGFTAAAQDRAEKASSAAEKLETLQETIEDRNRQRWERWATVPDCIRAVIDMAEVEREDGKHIPLPGNLETLRINVSNHLKKNKKRRRGSDSKPYYQTADIAEAVAIFYKAFDAVQYLREFKNIAIPSADIPNAEPKKAEHAKQSRGLSEEP